MTDEQLAELLRLVELETDRDGDIVVCRMIGRVAVSKQQIRFGGAQILAQKYRAMRDSLLDEIDNILLKIGKWEYQQEYRRNQGPG